MSITSYDLLIAALQAGKGQTRYIQKGSAGITLLANGPYSLWAQGGMPAAGSFGGTTPGAWTTQDQSTVGALKFNNPTGPDLQHLIAAAMTASAANAGTMMIYDRLGQIEYLQMGSVASTAITSDFTARLASGEGCQLFAEITTATTGGTCTFTVNYTNQAGTASKVSGTVTCTAVLSAAAGRFPYTTSWFIPLAAGDTGVRSVQSFDVTVAGTLNNRLNLVACKPLCFLPLNSAGVHVERDLVLATPEIPKIFDNACLAFAMLPIATTAQAFNGYMKTVAG